MKIGNFDLNKDGVYIIAEFQDPAQLEPETFG